MPALTNPAASLALLLMFLGLVGSVVPLVPGPPLIWLGALAWAVGNNFRGVDWITLAILGVLALAATFSEHWLTPIAQRRAGYGLKHIAAALVGGIAGGIVLSGVPVIGTLFGAAVGSVAATVALSYWHLRDLRAALRAGRTYLTGCALSSLVEVTLSLAMIAIFVWRAFFA